MSNESGPCWPTPSFRGGLRRILALMVQSPNEEFDLWDLAGVYYPDHVAYEICNNHDDDPLVTLLDRVTGVIDEGLIHLVAPESALQGRWDPNVLRAVFHNKKRCLRGGNNGPSWDYHKVARYQERLVCEYRFQVSPDKINFIRRELGKLISYGLRIKTARERAGLSKRQLNQSLGVSSIGQWESCQNVPTGWRRMRLEEFMRDPHDWARKFFPVQENRQ